MSKIMTKFEKLFELPSANQVSAFEQRYKISLPSLYRNFLQTVNGGLPTPNKFEIPDCGESALADVLYGLAPSSQAGDLGVEYEQLRNELPEGFLPIGHDPGGNYLLLATIGDRAGRIYYWDATHFFRSSNESRDTYLIAKNLDEFLESLT
jgi:hypothetical protein